MDIEFKNGWIYLFDKPIGRFAHQSTIFFINNMFKNHNGYCIDMEVLQKCVKQGITDVSIQISGNKELTEKFKLFEILKDRDTYPIVNGSEREQVLFHKDYFKPKDTVSEIDKRKEIDSLKCRIEEFCKEHPAYTPDKKIVIAKGNINGKILIIGEALGVEEDKQGIPFCGKSGKLLDKWLNAAGIKGNVGITNVMYFMPTDSVGKIRKPTMEEILQFKPYVLKLIEIINPDKILLLGSTATQCILERNISSTLNKSHSFMDKEVLTMYHPAYYLRNNIDGVNDFLRLGLSNKLSSKNMLVIDIETDGKSIDDAKMKMFGAYSFKDDTYYTTTSTKEAQKILNTHDILVGYNIDDFDIPILRKNGVFVGGQLSVDLLKAVRASGRIDAMGFKGIENKKLNTVASHIGIGNKLTLPLEILQKKIWSKEDEKTVTEYLRRDVEITKKLFDWWCDWSKPFKELVSEENQNNMTYLTSSVSSLAYKALCHDTGIKEEYDQREIQSSFEGGFVSADMEEARGKIVLLDFSSLYPHIMFQFNLFSPVDDDYKGKIFSGNELFKNIKGKYNAEMLGVVEKTLIKFYKLRKLYKEKGDKREYALKLILNSTYGAATNKVFKNIYNPTIGPDTTGIGRQCVKFAREMFLGAGLEVVYTDTDSVFVRIPQGKTFEDVLTTKKAIEQKILENVPFPQDTFSLAVEKKIKYFQTFRNLTDELGKTRLKKLYLYVTKDDELVVKGLRVIKRDCSKISKKVFETLKQDIIKNLDCKFPESKIKELIETYIKEDVSLLARRFEVKEVEFYKVLHQQQAQIAKTYGSGVHYLIKNKKVGAGKSVFYCTIKEAEKLSLDDLDFSSVYSELSYFIKEETRQTGLMEW